MKLILGLAILGLLTACAVGPDFIPPQPPDVISYTEQPLPTKTATPARRLDDVQQYAIAGEIPADWWELFHSATLNDLIHKGIKHSPSLQAAAATLKQAEENLRALQGATLLPAITAGLSRTRQETGTASLLAGADPAVSSSPFNLYNTSVQVAYTLDIFGANRRAIEAAMAQVDYQRFEMAAAYLALTANIVTTAITEAALREHIRSTHKIISLQEKQLLITRKQHELGGVSHAAVLEQQNRLAQTQAQLPVLEKNLCHARHAMAVLVGDYPGQKTLPKITLSELQLPGTLPVSLPAQLIRQRPDIRAAEALLQVTTAKIGVATANLLPNFPLTASIGTQAELASDLFGNGTRIWSWQAQVLQTLFNGGSLFAQRKAAIAAFEAAYAQYQLAVLTGLQNVGDTLVALQTDTQVLQAYKLAWQLEKQQVTITRQQHALGGISYWHLLNAEIEYQQAQINWTNARAARYADTVALFQAIGGAWWKQNLFRSKENKQ